MNENKFSPGDVVLLQSGGVPMTVTVLDSGRVNCVWQDTSGCSYDQWFYPESICHASENERFRLGREHDLLRIKLELEQMKSVQQANNLGLKSPAQNGRFPNQRR